MPSPALKLRRPSVRHECNVEEGVCHHRRGLSLESVLQDRDEDLALFQDMRTRERNNFLHPSTDDIDESLSIKLRGLSDFRLDISTPSRRESRDLLNTNVDKNDYDWLLTPPDTPLFPSLDQETPFVNLCQRGTLQSRLMTAPRLSRAQSRSRIARSSASPQRFPAQSKSRIARSSASPQRSSTTCTHSYFKGKASPTASANGSPKLQPLTPSGRSSTRMRRPSTPSAKSATPTFQRSSTSSSGHPSLVGRSGPSQGKTRSSSSSPKIQPWHSNIPGFSSEPPPNLRTTLPDRPTSHVRVLSPASRRGRETGNRSRRQSVSPTISRSASSSNDRDHFSPHSKGSVVSSCEDEMDSIQSTRLVRKRAYTDNQVGWRVTRKQEACPNTRVQSTPKRQARSLSSTNVSYGSDPAMQQMDFRRNSKVMFRPLLSSAPTTSFYTQKVTNLQCRTSSINSSVTTSSTASSERGACVAPDIEGSDNDAQDLGNEQENDSIHHCQEEIIGFDKMEVKHGDAGRQSAGIGSLQSSDPDYQKPEKTSGISNLHIDLHADCHGCKICGPSIREVDKWNHGEVLLDSNLSVESNSSVMGNVGCNYGQSADINHTQHNHNGPDTHESMVVCLDSQRKEVINSNYDPVGSYFVNIQRDVPLNWRSTKNIHDGTLGNLQENLLRNLEIETMQKHDHGSRKDVLIHDMTEKEVKESSSTQMNNSVDCQPMHLQDCISAQSAVGTGHQFSDQDLSKTKWVNSMSGCNRDEDFTHSQCRDDIQPHTASVGLPSRDMLSKVSLECKAEHSFGCLLSMGSPSGVNSRKQAALLVEEAGNATNLLREKSHPRGHRNEVKYFVKYDINASTSDIGSITQTKTSDLCQITSRKLDLESNSCDSDIDIPSGGFIPTAGVQNGMDRASIDNENASMKAHIDYCLGAFEITNGVKSETSERTAAASDVLSDAHQSEDLDSLLENSSIHVLREFSPRLQENHLDTAMDVKMKDAIAMETWDQEGKRLCNDVSTLEKEDQRNACTESCEPSEKSSYSYYEQVGNNAVREAKQVAVGSSEQEKDSTSYSDILLNRTDFSIQSNSFLVVSNEDTATEEKRVDILLESQISFQTEVATTTADQSISQREKGSSDCAASEGHNYNQSTDVELKNPPDYDNAEQAHVSQGDSGIKTDASRGYLSRSLTLAEATDTVLFCSSIVHNLVYKAATIAMEKENFIPVANPGPPATALGMSVPELRNLSPGAAARHTSTRAKKIKSRKKMAQVQNPSNKYETQLKDQESVVHVVTVPQRDDIARSRKRNSKCHCTVM